MCLHMFVLAMTLVMPMRPERGNSSPRRRRGEEDCDVGAVDMVHVDHAIDIVHAVHAVDIVCAVNQSQMTPRGTVNLEIWSVIHG